MNVQTFLVCFFMGGLLFACKTEDPRCEKVARNIASFAVTAAKQKLGLEGEELAQIQKQAEEQIEKVKGQCNKALANDKDGGVSLWLDCMSGASGAEDAQRCHSVGTRPDY